MPDTQEILSLIRQEAKGILESAAADLLHGDERSQQVAERAAELAISGFFLKLGVDTSDPLAMQKDFAHLRAWRESMDLVKTRGIISAVTVIVTGILGILYAAFTHKF
jgi:hypothetical protein